MSTVTVLRVTSKGQITLPQEIRERLDVHEGEDITLQGVAKGIVILSKSSLSRQQAAESLLKSLVLGIGQEAEKIGIHDEEDLDAIVKILRRRSFEERCGGTEAVQGLR
jgi:AbrB family looped-hinge helix DNA binding protein